MNLECIFNIHIFSTDLFLNVYEGIKPTSLFVSRYFEAYSPDNENDLVSDFRDLDFEGKQVKQASR